MILKSEIPFVRLLIPLIIGISVAWLLPSEFIFNQTLIFLFFLLGIFTFLIFAYKKFNSYKIRWLIGLTAHIFLFILAYHIAIRKSQRFDPTYFTNNTSDALLVKITNEPKITSDILRFETQVTYSLDIVTVQNVKGKLLIALKTDSLKPINLSYGDLLLIPARFNEIEQPYNPAEFNFKKYLETQQIYQQAFINASQIKLLKHNTANPIIAYALNLRKQLVAKFYRYLPDKESAALASTLILGYRADLSKEVISAYSKTGTMHVLSVSGMHVGIVFLVLSFLLKPLNKTHKLRIFSALLMITVIWFYSLITGFSPSVCRAAMMLTFVVLGKALNKNLNTYNLLAISAFFLLLYNPFYLLDVGFQLSYLAVIGLVYLHSKIYHSIYIKNKILDWAWSYCALSVAAQLATFPISIYYFHQFPVYFLISNLFIVLPVAVLMYAGIAFLFIPWDAVLKPLGVMLNWLISFTNNILFYIENLPFSSWGGIWINSFQYLFMYLIIGSVIWAVSLKNKF
ncbi:MAG: ComEC/Rec2 family competence protein, partial [Daejeonella sp.]